MPSAALSIGSGTLFIQSWAVAGLPQSLGLVTRHFGPWQLITNLSAGMLEQRLTEAGWHLCSIVPSIDAAAVGGRDIVLHRALQRLFQKAAGQDLNALEITAVERRKLFGWECLSLSALARHVEKEPVSQVMRCAARAFRGGASEGFYTNE